MQGQSLKAAITWFNRLAAGGLVLVGLAIIVTGVMVGVLAWSPTPVWDQWDAATSDQIKDLLKPHNEHRIALSRLIFQADIAFGHGTGALSLVAMYLFNAAHLVLLIVLAWWTWPKAGATRLVAAGAIAAAFFFSGFQYENFVSGFQNQFTGVFFFASSAIAALCVAASREDQWRKILIAFSVLLTVIGVSCMANGLLIAPLLVVVALVLGLRATAWIMALVAAICWFNYFRDFPVREGPSAVSTLVSDPFGFIENVLAYVGGAAPNSISALNDPFPYKIEIARAFGAVAMLTIGGLSLFALWKPVNERPRIVVWAAIGLFVFASAAVTALGRADLGDVAMLATRYGAGTAAVWAIVAIWAVMPARGPVLSLSLVSASALSLLLVFAQLPWLGAGQGYKVRRLEAEAALLSQADSQPAYLGVYPAPNRAPTIGKVLRQQNLAMFYEPWRRLFGQTVVPAAAVCKGEIKDVVSLIRSADPTWRVAITGELPQGARGVAVTTPEASVAGLLIRGLDDDINSKLFMESDAPPRWSGYVHLAAARTLDLSFQAVDASGQPICRLDKTLRLAPSDAARLVDYKSVGAAVAAVQSKATGVFPANGFNEAAGTSPWNGRNWGSWGGDDKNTGTIRLSVNVEGVDRVAVPLVTGPTASGSRFEARVDGVVVQKFAAPADVQRWSAVEIRLPPGSKVLEVMVEDASTAWGGWIAVGEPHLMCVGSCQESVCPETFVSGEVVPGLSGGFVDGILERDDTLVVRGWAGDTKTGLPVDHVIAVVDGNHIVACLQPDQPRTDVAGSTGFPLLSNSGFSLTTPATNRRGLVLYSRQSDGSLARLNGL